MGLLDGLAVLRYAPIWRQGGGGMEEHLKEANSLLLQRNRMTIVQTYLQPAGTYACTLEEVIGMGTVIWVPISRLAKPLSPSSRNLSVLLEVNRRWEGLLPRKLMIALLQSLATKTRVGRGDWFRSHTQELGSLVNEIISRHKVDLGVVHSLGSLDDAEVLVALLKANVPIAALHHFENRRLAHPLVRLKLGGVAAVGGISDIDVPRYLRQKFARVYEGIDTEFFDLANARPIRTRSELGQLVLLPARIVASKGQIDLVKALSLLNRSGSVAKLAFAGRAESDEAMSALVNATRDLSHANQVLFLGELDRDSLRDWYALASVIAMPSHSEGFSRVLLEAQAMRRPVVAYKVGGVPEAVADGISGYLVPKGDVGALAARVSELLADGQKREKMGLAGRRLVEHRFSAPRLVESHERLYAAALRRGASLVDCNGHM